MLADFTVEWRDLAFKGGSFRVRGLSLDDLATMIRDHVADFQRMYSVFATPQDGADRTELILSMVRDMPDLTAHLIAAAAGEESAQDKARLLPFPLQLVAVNAVLEMTFDEIGGPKNLGPALLKLLSNAGVDGLPKTTAGLRPMGSTSTMGFANT